MTDKETDGVFLTNSTPILQLSALHFGSQQTLLSLLLHLSAALLFTTWCPKYVPTDGLTTVSSLVNKLEGKININSSFQFKKRLRIFKFVTSPQKSPFCVKTNFSCVVNWLIKNNFSFSMALFVFCFWKIQESPA